MSVFLAAAFLFFIGCVAGWVLELFYRRFAHHKWINPGFLIGPYLPLYGSGLSLMFFICYFGSYIKTGSRILDIAIVLVIITAAMTLIEYFTGLVFIKGMKIKLWDYSNNFGNIQGIICPLFTFFWGAIGAIYYFFVHCLMLKSLAWFINNIAFSFVIGMFFGIIAIDAAYSLRLAAHIKKWASENNIVVKYEELKLTVSEKIKEAKDKGKFFFAAHMPQSIVKELEHYRDFVSSIKISEIIKKHKNKK